jgi:hypothetical protein
MAIKMLFQWIECEGRMRKSERKEKLRTKDEE